MRLIEWEVAEDGYEEQIVITNEKRKLAAEEGINTENKQKVQDITIWEYLYYCSNRDKSYNYLKRITLNTKINCLVKEYLMRNISTILEDCLRVFSDIRNQLSHNGKFPIENPNSPFRHLGWNECEKYLNLVKHLTQVLVLKTLGISAFNQMSAFDVKTKLQELVRNRAI